MHRNWAKDEEEKEREMGIKALVDDGIDSSLIAKKQTNSQMGK